MPKLSLHSKDTLAFTRAEAGDVSRLAVILFCTLMRWDSETTLPILLMASTVTWYLRMGCKAR